MLTLRLEQADLAQHTQIMATKDAVLAQMTEADGMLRDALKEESRARSERYGARRCVLARRRNEREKGGLCEPKGKPSRAHQHLSAGQLLCWKQENLERGVSGERR